MTSYEIIPPGSSRCLWKWLAPSRTWGVILMFSPWMFHVGLEVWRYGVTFNIGPLALGGCSIRPTGDE